MIRRKVDTSVRYFEQPAPKHPDSSLPPDARVHVPEAEPYDPSPELIEAVNLAIALKRPLLVQGEPGCGKTRLAYAIASNLGLPLFREIIKSTSRARDLCYQYDAVARLFDAQLGENGPKDVNRKLKFKSASTYITLGSLGEAIKLSHDGHRSVVLIDEIDKADIDFPNDLLWELEHMQFRTVEEPILEVTAHPDVWPIVVVTHNEEKALPDAFLRRCVYHYIEFPTGPQLRTILKLHEVSQPIGERGIEIIQRLRSAGLTKKPGVAELIDWAGYRAEVEKDGDVVTDGIPSLPALVKLKKDHDTAVKVADDMAREAAASPSKSEA
ncbi:MAG: AAA family ATPase [Capsulimonadaceae bacterium]